MSFQRQIAFWVAAVVVFVLLFWLLSDILLPFIAGMALAYLLDPVARRAGQFGISRGVAALIIVTLVILAFVIVVMTLAPVVSSQFRAFTEHLPAYTAKLQSIVSDPSRPWSKLLGAQGDASKSVGELVSQGSGYAATVLAKLWSGGRAVFSLLSLLIITPVVAFYLLCDWEELVATVDGWIPLHHRDTVHALARDIDAAIAGFVRGQGVICLVLAAYYSIGLTLTGLNFGFLIGMMTGLLSFIPFVGAGTGFVVAAIVAIAQFWPDWISIVMVGAVFLIGQGLEGYVLSPKLVGARVGLHPVWMMFALLAFGYLFGFVGLLVAVPLAATIGVLLRFAIRKYMESPIYTGQGSR